MAKKCCFGMERACCNVSLVTEMQLLCSAYSTVQCMQYRAVNTVQGSACSTVQCLQYRAVPAVQCGTVQYSAVHAVQGSACTALLCVLHIKCSFSFPQPV
jgi:hypothetical protein